MRAKPNHIGVDKMLSEFATRYGFHSVTADFEDGWLVVLRGRIGDRTLEVRDGKNMGDALDKLIRRWPRPETWPPSWLLPPEKAWTNYPWPFGPARDYYDREPGDGRCCKFDHDGDGNCHVHSAPGQLRGTR